MTRKNSRLNALYRRIVGKKASQEEKNIFNTWYENLDLQEQQRSSDAEEEFLEERLRTNLQRYIASQDKSSRLSKEVRLYRVVAAVAAVLLCCFGFLGYFQRVDVNLASSSVSYTEVKAMDKIKTFLLPDSTKITLNIGSSLRYPSTFNLAERRVEMIGEAFFDVKHDSDRPFIVMTDSLETRVLGTSFNVESYPNEDQIKVALVRGSVKLVNRSHTQPSQTLLSPGEMLAYDRLHAVVHVGPIIAKDIDAWTKGGLVFNEIPLSAAIDRLALRYNLKVFYNKDQVKGKTISASFNEITWQKALHAILFANDMNYTIRKEVIYIE